jgi:hypothetical protein
MLTAVLAFLKSHWQTALIASAILSVIATISLQHLEIVHAEGKLARCHAENVTLEDSNRALLASIQRQNAAITSLEASAQSRKAAAARALAAARLSAGRHDLAAQRIEGRQALHDECDAMKKLVNDFIAGRSR